MEIIRKWELKKSILNKKAVTLVIILIIGKIVSSLIYNANIPDDVDEYIYREYTGKLEGRYTSQKALFIENEIERISELVGNEFYYLVKYEDGLITLEEFEKIQKEIRNANSILSTLSYISEKCDYYENVYANGVFFYDLDIQRYMSVMGIDFIGMIFVTYFCISLFFSDKSVGVETLVRTSYYGTKQTRRLRLIIGLTGSVSFVSFMSLLEFVIKYISLDINYFDMPVKTMLSMSDFPIDLSIGQGLLLIYGVRIVMSMVMVFVCWLVDMYKRV